ncbi:F-box protein PP2-B11-like [Coffea arabica]|uniref:F-box protein PP2-B11-like n=1 Tax=Coffea arabica TaxID=13443 RepID=A0ABM4X2G5_COFAR|nr:F-box protein PP2-B11-like [Coffea arabica]
MEGPFARLPEGFISEILSLTSPVDVIRASVVSKGFKPAADSDTIWEKFLPSDYQDIISRSDSAVDCSTKKALYFSLCDSPLLLDGGRMGFSVDKRSGKKCYMVGARELIIAWARDPWYWHWISRPDSRFREVAKLKAVCWLDIRGRIESQMLSTGTTYAAFLVFKIAEEYYGIEKATSLIRFVNHESDGEAKRRAAPVHLVSREGMNHPAEFGGKFPKMRTDGWMELELGKFYTDRGDDGQVEARLIEIISLHGKSGLIVEGIEFRPV